MTPLRMTVLALLALCCCITTAAEAGAAELVNKEGNALIKKKFTGTGGETVLETTSGANIKCKKSAATGEVTSTTAATQTVTYSECKNSLGQKCKTEGGSVEEQIKIEGIKETFAYNSGGERSATDLVSELASTFKFLCSTIKNEVKGRFIVPVGKEQEGTLKTSFAFTGKAEKGKMEIQTAESLTGESITSTLEAKLLTSEALFEQAAQTGTETLTFEEGAKVVALLKLSIENVGGVEKRGAKICEFKLKNETCTLEVKNLSGFKVEVKKEEITGPGGRYGIDAPAGCAVGSTLAESKLGGKCEDVVRLLVNPEEKWFNNYFIEVEAPNGTRTAINATLKTV